MSPAPTPRQQRMSQNDYSANEPIVDRFIKQIDRTVTEIATRQFIGARILPVYQVVSEGTTEVSWFDLTEMKGAVVDMDGLTDNADSASFTPQSQRMPVVQKAFKLSWRDLAAAKAPADGGTNKPLDVANVQEATRQVLLEVDRTVFQGHSQFGIEGMTNKTGRNTFAGADWGTQGQAYEDITDALSSLESQNYFGPYLGVVHPTQYGETRRVFTGTGIPQRAAIEEMFDAGYYRTPAITAATGLIFSQGSMNSDLMTATGGPKQKNYQHMKFVEFMLYDITVPRVRRAKSIVTLSSI